MEYNYAHLKYGIATETVHLSCRKVRKGNFSAFLQLKIKKAGVSFSYTKIPTGQITIERCALFAFLYLNKKRACA
jgi:hypothetical protein